MLQKPAQRFDEFTPEQLRQLEARKWSDLLRDMAELKIDLAAHRQEVQEIRHIFEQAKGAVVLIKWGSAVIVFIGGAAAWVTQHIKWN